MRIHIARIPAEGSEIEDGLDSNALDLDRSDVKFISPLRVAARLIRTVNVVSADVDVSSRMKIMCSRCLENAEKDFIGRYNFNYEIGKEDSTIDLEPDIREEIILGFPVRLLCQDDCKGLCPKCGKNLNSGPCNCNK